MPNIQGSTARHLQLADEFGALGDQFCRQGDFRDARHMYERQLDQLEAELGSEHRDLVPVLLNAADACRSYGRVPPAERFQTRAMSILRMNLGVEENDQAALLDIYVNTLNTGGQRRLAVQMSVRARTARCRR